MRKNDITKRPARWTDCVKISAGELTGAQKLVLNLLPRVEKTAFDFPQSPTNLKGVAYVALFEIDRAAWIETDEDGKALLAFEFPAAILEDLRSPGAIHASADEHARFFREQARIERESCPKPGEKAAAILNKDGSVSHILRKKTASVDPSGKIKIEEEPTLGEFISVMMFVQRHRSAGAAKILHERCRQIYEEKFTAEHDANFRLREMAKAARAYLGHYVDRAWTITDEMAVGATAEDYRNDPIPDEWPEDWPESFWKPKSKIRDLVRAGALIAAEIDRLIAEMGEDAE